MSPLGYIRADMIISNHYYLLIAILALAWAVSLVAIVVLCIKLKRQQHENVLLQQTAAPPRAPTADTESPEARLYKRLCTLMDEQQPYADPACNREMLASLLGTNHRYVDRCIRKCAGGINTSQFINNYRLEHAARLLAQTDESVNIVVELSGFGNRTTFTTLFRNHFKTTPTDYRKAARQNT